MREIKFRAWTGAFMECNVMVGKFGAFFVNPGAKGDGLDELDAASLSMMNTKYPPSLPIMQFTGLKDKNGNEIYEGDILEGHVGAHRTRYEVTWFDGAWWAGTTLGSGFLKHAEVSVIGNIYENSDLLK